MINWRKIQDECPLSYRRFSEVMFPSIGVLGLSTLYLFDPKKLFGFFDKEKIFLTIDRFGYNQWVFTITLTDGRVLCPHQESRNTREEIEIDGFMECFRIMEQTYHVKD